MERLTSHESENYNQPGCNTCSDYRWRSCKESGEITDCIKRLTWVRLCSIEDILGDDYDLDRLRELVEADREGRCIVAPVKPGGFVRFKGNPRAPHEKVDCINIYADGKIMLAFHEYGVKETFVDDWSEDEAEKYISVEEE